jgi:RNA polymerase sigma factor (sigma-70 family)
MSAETAPALLEAASVARALAPAERSGDRSSPSATTASLYERYYDRVYGYCLYKLGNREEAEDATQTTFLLVLRALERGVVPRLEANWLFTIAQNACRCRVRTRGRGRDHEVLSDPQVLQEVAPGYNGAREELVGLEEALDDMPDLQRRAIILREWRGCSYREIAQQLNLTGSAVETLIFRARRSLAQRLEHQTIPSKRRAGAFALDFASIASALKSILGIGSGA